jgi:2-polyprenyl-3-methyl-5-hydroxy-6-metoxy-1,4-benzoquinol methylase
MGPVLPSALHLSISSQAAQINEFILPSQQHAGQATMNCPLCHNQSNRIFNRYDYWIRECRACHHRFAEISLSFEHVNHVYQDEYFKGGMAGYPDYLSEAGMLVEHGRQYGVLLNKYTLPGKILDIGSAAGFILRGFQESGWSGVGLEPNLSMANHGRKQFGLQIETGSLENFSSTQQFDAISMIQVIAHFFDIRKALHHATALTRCGGYWLIETWDRESWFARIFGKYWHEYSPPSVLHWFSPSGLARFVAHFGFSEVGRGRPVKRINGRHAKSLLKYKIENLPGAELLDRLMIVPDDTVIRYPAFDLFWILFQKHVNTGS